ncbi:MAG: drug:proton antiporter [Acidimicrobiales bacterium]|nr:MAG: drug:proton antiporter [Acidimicrobiales bacterium]
MRFGSATRSDAEVVVVGAGPAGASCAFWLALCGHEVIVLEKKRLPREKTCGDGLTPRAVHELATIGIDPASRGWHRVDGLRATAGELTVELPWPSHPVYPPYGYVVRRKDLDLAVAEAAGKAGALILEGVEALAPMVERGAVRGVVAKEAAGGERVFRSQVLVVADGANSRIGRALGAARRRSLPFGMAIRGYVTSPLHDDRWLESCLDIRDRHGRSLPGYGWVFPLGDGWLNVGVGLLSTYRYWRSVNTTRLYESYVESLPTRWRVGPHSDRTAPVGGKLPMGGSVSPTSGDGWLAIGDAAASINPFNGEGIDYAYETGRLAAQVLDRALRRGRPDDLHLYPNLVVDRYGDYWRTGRQFARLIGDPRVMRVLTRVGLRSPRLMSWVLRIMANLLRPGVRSPAEVTYELIERIAVVIPE